MDVIEMMARAWINCDPNRGGGEPGSGFHPDDPIEAGEDEQGNVRTTELTGKPRWHWFIPRAEATIEFLRGHGYEVVKRDGHAS